MKSNLYDIIGDVHGCAVLLKKLLKTMGYSKVDGTWTHPERTAIFIGDFINRGPQIRETIQIIRQMTEEGAALTILGNHEYSAVLYHIKDSKGMFLSRHIAGNRNQIQSTLIAFKGAEPELKSHLKWMRSLPFYLDLDEIRIVHAYWNDQDIRYLKAFIPEGRLKKGFLRTIHEEQHPSASIIYKVLKGLEYNLPQDLILKCDKGMSRNIFRMNWWESPKKKTFRELSFGNKFILPEYTVPKQIAPSFEPYLPDKPPVFIGHYSLNDGANIFQGNICCVDSNVTGTGQLSAYRWNGEKKLIRDNIITVSL
ncbi:MAG: metallophosphoesterase [Mariniphaga sp.]